MFEPDARHAPSALTAGPRRNVAPGLGAACWLTLVLSLGAGLLLDACAIPFGNGADPMSGPREERPRDRNRLYLEEQERMERERLFERVGPSDR